MPGMAQTSPLKLGLRLEVYRAAELKLPIDTIRQAEALGYHSVWSAEAYGVDALTPLAYIAAVTKHIKLGTAVCQVAARPPTTLAMAAMSIDALAGGGRVILGLGLSGPQIVEGWYGQPWGKPNVRLRDYTTILRQTLDREAPVAYEGQEISLPYRGPGALGQGKALKSILHPSSRIPIWIAAGGQRNVELAAEIADGWLPMGLGPGGTPEYASALDKGNAQRTSPPVDGVFEVFNGVTISITDDVRRRARCRQAAHRHVRRGHGQRDAPLPPRSHGPARLSRGGGPHRRAVAGRPQAGGRRGRAGRVPGADDAARFAVSGSARAGNKASSGPG